MILEIPLLLDHTTHLIIEINNRDRVNREMDGSLSGAVPPKK